MKKRPVCFRVRCCQGVFLARLILTWFHFLVNELQECDANDSMSLRLIWLFCKIMYFELIVDVATD